MATLPHETNELFITDGGLETSLLFQQGVDLPDFAAFPLLDRGAGQAALRRYYEPYLDIAASAGVPLVLDTPTWRASLDWGHRAGYEVDDLAAINGRAVAFVRELASARPAARAVLNGVIGPRGDGYVVGSLMTPAEAERYHSLQVRAFADAGAELVSAITMTYVEEAIGIARATRTTDLPVVISFTVETDGRLPSGDDLGAAVTAVDAATDGYPAYFMVNCAHPSHMAPAFAAGAPWLERVMGVRANASRLSHAELDEAEDLDRGEPAELAHDYVSLRQILPQLRVVGGCCGTDHEHIEKITAAVLAA
jgi:S-methylmethionine-dependent homocysteine/selenocysteine methylase